MTPATALHPTQLRRSPIGAAGAILIGLTLMPRLAQSAPARPAHAPRVATAARTPGKSQPEKARALLKLTLARFLRDLDVDAARQGLLASLKLAPEDVRPCEYLGRLAEMQEQWTEAIGWYTKFLKKGGASPTAATARQKQIRLKAIVEMEKSPEGRRKLHGDLLLAEARALLVLRQPDGALAAAAEANGLDDSGWETYAVAAAALAQRGCVEEAVRSLQQARERAPEAERRSLQTVLEECEREKEARAVARSGAQALAANDNTAAAGQLYHAWQLCPSQADLAMAAASACALAGEYEKGKEILERLVAGSDPKVTARARDLQVRVPALLTAAEAEALARQRFSKAEELLAQKQYAGAETEVRAAMRLQPENASYPDHLGRIFSQQGKWAEAEAAHREAIRLDPEAAAFHANLGWDLKGQKKYADAEAAFREAVRLEPDNAGYHNGLGVALSWQDKWTEAEAAYRWAIQLDATQGAFHANLGGSLRGQKQYAAAETAFREAMRLQPSVAANHHSLGVTLFDQEKWQSAEGEFREAVRLDAANGLYQADLAGALFKQDRLVEARVAAAEAVKLGATEHWIIKELGLTR